MNDPYFFMTVLAPAFILLPVIIALCYFKYLPAEGRALLYYLIAETVILATSSTLAFYSLPNIWLYHIATVVETLLLLLFFKAIFRRRRIAVYITRAMVIFPALAVLNTWLLQPLSNINSYSITLQYVLIILLCLCYWISPAEEPGIAWTQQPLNWIISGMLLYFSGSLILFVFSDYINFHFSKQTNIMIWNLHAAQAMLMYLLMAFGFYKYKLHE